MTTGEIIVPASAEQKKNFQDLFYGDKSFKDKFMKKLKEKDKEYAEQFKPFCYTCAKLDYEDEVSRVEKEKKRKIGKTDTIPEIDIGDLSKYGNDLYFHYLGNKSINETQIINNIRVPIKAYMRFEYKCKERGHGRTIDMPYPVYEEKFKNAKGTKV